MTVPVTPTFRVGPAPRPSDTGPVPMWRPVPELVKVKSTSQIWALFVPIRPPPVRLAPVGSPEIVNVPVPNGDAVAEPSAVPKLKILVFALPPFANVRPPENVC